MSPRVYNKKGSPHLWPLHPQFFWGGRFLLSVTSWLIYIIVSGFIILVQQISSVQSLSRILLFVTPWIEALQASLSITNSWSSPILMCNRVGDAIQPSHPLLSPSPPAPNPSQHQSLFQWVNSSHEVAKVLEFQLSHHSFQRTFRADLL